MKKTLRIAFVSEYDIRDATQRSGVPYYIAKALKELGHEIIQIGPFDNKRKLRDRLFNVFLVTLFNRLIRGRMGWINNQWSREFLRNYAEQTERVLSTLECDLVFSPDSSTIAYLETDKPIVFWRDATFHNLLDYYPEFSNIHPHSVREGNFSVLEALKRTTLAIYTSNWAANSAIDYYKADPSKIAVIERGANLEKEPTVEEILLENKWQEKMRILFIGANWKRKGGDIVFKTVSYLNENGFPTELHAVGAVPDIKKPTPPWFFHYGFLKKSNQEHITILDMLYKHCHFFMMPSMAENFGIVYAESSAYGVPSIGYDTGGVGSAIHHLKNGLLFKNNSSYEEMANQIQLLYANKDNYLALCHSTRQDYEARLNWKTNVRRMCQLFGEKMGE